MGPMNWGLKTLFTYTENKKPLPSKSRLPLFNLHKIPWFLRKFQVYCYYVYVTSFTLFQVPDGWHLTFTKNFLNKFFEGHRSFLWTTDTPILTTLCLPLTRNTVKRKKRDAVEFFQVLYIFSNTFNRIKNFHISRTFLPSLFQLF